MKRTLIACAALALGATAVLAASPEVAKAIKTIKSVDGDAAKMKQFCTLVDAVDDAAAEGAADAKAAAKDEKKTAADDAALDKEIDGALGQLGDDFTAAWDAGDELDENTADGKEYFAAVDSIAAKCE